MKGFVVSLLMIFIAASSVSAQNTDIEELMKQVTTESSVEISVPPDTSTIVAVPYSEAVLKKFQKDGFYDYDRDRISFSERLQNFINRWLLRAIGKTISVTAVRTLCWILGIAVVIAVIIIILKKNTNIFYFAKNKRLSYRIDDEDIENQNYDVLLEKAVRSGQYANAIRWQFMKTLQHLQKRHLISFDSYKTVNEYIYELSETELRSQFKALSYSFVYYHYGHGEVNESRFTRFRDLSEELIKMIGK